MMPEDPKLESTVRRVVSLLVRGDYEALERLTNGARLTAAEMAAGVREYGGNLVVPPDGMFNNLDVIEVEGTRPRKWSVNVDLWTAEEGRSDLTLELTFRESGKKIYDVEVDTIHVPRGAGVVNRSQSNDGMHPAANQQVFYRELGWIRC